MTSRSCSWCHEMNTLNGSAPTFCSKCGHRADVCRLECDCQQCRRHEPPRDVNGVALEVGNPVEFVEQYQGFAGGTVGELLLGILGPVAGVVVEPGRMVDTLCRRLRKK